MSKYDTYKIVVKENNRERNVFESGNYMESINQYKKIKSANSEKNCKVQFVAFNNKDSTILWEKSFIADNYNDVKNETSNRNVDDKIEFLSEFKKAQKLVKSMKNQHEENKKLLDCLNKKRDVYYHQIEYNINQGISDDKKVEMYNQLGELANNRRDIKNRINVYENIKANICQLESNIGAILKTIDNTYIKNTKEINFSKNHIKNYKFYEEKHYKSDVEKVKIQTKFQKIFETVTIDDIHKIIFGYNHGYDRKDNLVKVVK